MLKNPGTKRFNSIFRTGIGSYGTYRSQREGVRERKQEQKNKKNDRTPVITRILTVRVVGPPKRACTCIAHTGCLFTTICKKYPGHRAFAGTNRSL